MKKTILAFVLLASASSAWAEVQIRELLVRKKGADVNVRVNIENPGGPAVRKPTITLYVRPNSSAAWQQVKVWNNIAKIGVNEKVSRDFFEENNAELRAIAENPAWEARAVLRVKGWNREVTKVSVYHDSESGNQ